MAERIDPIVDRAAPSERQPAPPSNIERPALGSAKPIDRSSEGEGASDAAVGAVAGSQSGEGAGVGESGEPITLAKLEEMVIDAVRTVYDPEIPVNIYDLGLVYDLRVEEDRRVVIKMTLTTPACPVAGSMPGMVEKAVRHLDAVADCEVELVWEPPWNPDMMTEAARLQLNI